MNVPLIVLLCVALLCALCVPTLAQEWDRSSLSVVGSCVAGGALQVVVTNTGQAMAGPTAYEFATLTGHPEVRAVVASGSVPALATGGTFTTVSPLLPGVKIEFTVWQRPGHAGSGVARAVLRCSPTAVELAALSAEPAPLLLGIPLWSSSAAGAGRMPPSWLSVPPPYEADGAPDRLAQPTARQWAGFAWRTLARFGRVVPSP